MDVLKRNNVNVNGAGTKPMLFVHGYGCDQNMWRFITPAFVEDYKLVLLDLVGSGKSDLGAYSRAKYGSLEGYASDILEICDALDLRDAVFVGHSVSAMIAVLCANREPGRFSHLVLVGPSPCYVNDGDYTGGFNRPDIEGLLEFLDANFLGWSRQLAPAIMGVPDRPELAEELTNSFCRTDPEIARHFGKVTFLSDYRNDAAKCTAPSLILQCSNDIVAPVAVGQWLNRHMAKSSLVLMQANGHCPHLSAPEETIAAMQGFLKPAA
jgi:sigma-B regulation protein RsbQ